MYAPAKFNKEPRKSAYGDEVYGQHETWLSFYDFFLNECNIEGLHILDGLIMIAESAGWWIPYENVAFVADRPCALHLDDVGRLHCENAKAIEWVDRWGIYVWHGTVIDEKIIMHPETITMQQINDENNTTVRRILMERFGEGRYMEESGAKFVHQDNYGQLYHLDLKEDDPEQVMAMVRVINSTIEPDGRQDIHWIRVDPKAKTAHEAIAKSFGLLPKYYHPDAEA
jgi:hypothetical protein